MVGTLPVVLVALHHLRGGWRDLAGDGMIKYLHGYVLPALTGLLLSFVAHSGFQR